jgi:hypothetical protein
MVKQPH